MPAPRISSRCLAAPWQDHTARTSAICVLTLLCLCPNTAIYLASSYYCICVLIPLCVSRCLAEPGHYYNIYIYIYIYIHIYTYIHTYIHMSMNIYMYIICICPHTATVHAARGPCGPFEVLLLRLARLRFYYCICVLILLYMCVLILLYMQRGGRLARLRFCYICVLILLCRYVCILLYLCPHTAINMCPQVARCLGKTQKKKRLMYADVC